MNFKKFILSALSVCVLGLGTQAQNLQLHFDTRHSMYGSELSAVNYLTATYEMFKVNRWGGSTYMFVDFDFSFDDRNVGLVYGEISHDFKIKNFPLMPHIEYNGGLGIVRGTSTAGYSINSAYLAGFSYPFKLGRFFMSSYLTYKLNAFEKRSHDAQWTVIWNGNFFDGKLTVSGFADCWTANKATTKADTQSGKRLIFISEPQFWYNCTPNLSIGNETEVSCNFQSRQKKWYFVPTLAARWAF